jgi:hypothetical protein
LREYHAIQNKVKLLRTDKQLFAYGTNSKLDLIGYFEAEARANGMSHRSTFYVYNGLAKCLMYFDTAFALELVSVNENVVANILPDYTKAIFNQFPNVFKGVGKLKGVKLRLHIDRDVTPVAQPVRRLPYGFRDKVRMKIKELVANDVVEPVEGGGYGLG